MAKTVLLQGKETDHENINTDHITDSAKAIVNEDVTTEVVDHGILVTCQSEEGAAALLAKGSLTVFDKELVISKPELSSAKASSKFDGVKLHVKNLPEEMTRDTLKALFQAHGTVNHSQVQTNKEGKSKGFGQVTMSTKEEADKAIAALHDIETNGATISVILAPEQGPKPEKGEKGKGKGKSDKGKGKGKAGKEQQSYAGWQNTSPDMDWQQQMMQQQMNPYMQMGMNPYAGYDPVYNQIMQQQMMTMQLYSTMMAQQQPATNDPGKGKGKAKGKGKGKDKGSKVEGKFTGTLKSINFREDKGYGFINCAETKTIYGRDVYVSADLTGEGAKVGDKFDFSVILDQRGQLRATNVKRNA